MTHLTFKVIEISPGSRFDLRTVRFEVHHDPLAPPGSLIGQLTSAILSVGVLASTADALHEDASIFMELP